MSFPADAGARGVGTSKQQGEGHCRVYRWRVTVWANEKGRLQAVAPTNRTPTGELWSVEPDRIRFRAG